MESRLLYEDLTYEIIGAAMETSKSNLCTSVQSVVCFYESARSSIRQNIEIARSRVNFEMLCNS